MHNELPAGGHGTARQNPRAAAEQLGQAGRHGRNNAGTGGECPSVRPRVRVCERSVTPAAPGTKSSGAGGGLPGVQGKRQDLYGILGGTKGRMGAARVS